MNNEIMLNMGYANSDGKLGVVFWITGLSGAGKSTVAKSLGTLLDQSPRAHVHLDGDDLREVFSDVVGFDPDQRLILAHRYSRLCKLLSHQGVDVICSTISLFSEIHKWNRENFRKYVEVYLEVDLDILKGRDPKGLYRRAEAGEIDNVMGVNLPIEVPEIPDLVVRNDGHTDPASIAKTIMEVAMRRTGEDWAPIMGISR